MNDGAKWYVLQVAAQKELECKRRIKAAGFMAIVPTRIMPELRNGRWSEREIVMLPGYVFVRCLGTVEHYYRLSGIPDTIRILPGNGTYRPVPEDQMRWIIELSNGGEPWGVSTGINSDGRFKVLSGPLVGREHLVLNWDKRRRRAKILIRVLDEKRRIDVGLIESSNL